MPLCTIHLLSLTPSTSISTFLRTLSSTSLNPILVSRVIRWIILPTTLSTVPLLAKNIRWDILLLLPSISPLPPALASLISHQFTLTAGVPSRLLTSFPEKNHRLLHPKPGDVPKLTNEELEGGERGDSQDLELSEELKDFIKENEEGKGAVSMLNFLAFKEGMKDSYLKYGAEFAKSIGKDRGGVAKIVGTVVNDGKGVEGWDEIAVAHYPSLRHFGEMLGSEDYQRVNRRYRVPSLRDTCILFTSELGLDWEGEGKGEGKAKL